MDSFKWEIFPHPPYSPDLAPSDFHLFPQLKLHLGGKHFPTAEELKTEVSNYLLKSGTPFYYQGISKLLSRYQKCIDVDGDYVEK